MGYRLIVVPLTQLLCKDSFHWDDETIVAFDKLKQAMITLPVLVLPDSALPFFIETDASRIGIGVVLSQKRLAIAFFNQTLSMRACSKPVYERELMAVTHAVQKLRHYLLGQKFTVLRISVPYRHLLE